MLYNVPGKLSSCFRSCYSSYKAISRSLAGLSLFTLFKIKRIAACHVTEQQLQSSGNSSELKMWVPVLPWPIPKCQHWHRRLLPHVSPYIIISTIKPVSYLCAWTVAVETITEQAHQWKCTLLSELLLESANEHGATDQSWEFSSTPGVNDFLPNKEVFRFFLCYLCVCKILKEFKVIGKETVYRS